MAGIRASAAAPVVALVAATAKTVLQLTAPTNQRVRILEIGVSFDGTTNTNAPGTVMLYLQTTAGTATGLTCLALPPVGGETIQTTASYNASAEPTKTSLLQTWAVHPQTGLIYQVPKGDELILAGGTRIGIYCTFAQIVNCYPYIKFEE